LFKEDVIKGVHLNDRSNAKIRSIYPSTYIFNASFSGECTHM